MKKFGFSYISRLHTPAEYKAVFSLPIRSASRCFTILARPNQMNTARLGVIVAKKIAGRAVDRNRFKRWVRESFRVSKDKLSGLDIVVLAKSDLKKIQDFNEVSKILNLQWDEILKQWKK